MGYLNIFFLRIFITLKLYCKFFNGKFVPY